MSIPQLPLSCWMVCAVYDPEIQVILNVPGKHLQVSLISFLYLLSELTHEFLQILEKTPSRLKRIRNWKVQIYFSFATKGVKPRHLALYRHLLLADLSVILSWLPGWRLNTKSQAQSPGGG